jgi:uncharacterized membrane protein
MKEAVELLAEWGTGILEIMGILVIVSLAIWSLIMAIADILKGKKGELIYETYRHVLARGILFGLELLVAADIIKTVAFELSFSNIGMLALLVILRTFLSFVLNVEASGKWPWQEQG